VSRPGAGSAAGTRGRKALAGAVAVLVVVVVAVLVGLLGPGDPQEATPAPGGATSAATSGSRRPTAPVTPSPGARDPESGLRVVALTSLPREAQQTVALVDAGGPFPYSQDGVTFGNYERVLPAHARGWYREYTVRTPGERDRGPRRIVTGDRDRQVFYTGDHYATFVRVSR